MDRLIILKVRFKKDKVEITIGYEQSREIKRTIILSMEELDNIPDKASDFFVNSFRQGLMLVNKGTKATFKLIRLADSHSGCYNWFFIYAPDGISLSARVVTPMDTITLHSNIVEILLKGEFPEGKNWKDYFDIILCETCKHENNTPVCFKRCNLNDKAIGWELK